MHRRSNISIRAGREPGDEATCMYIYSLLECINTFMHVP